VGSRRGRTNRHDIHLETLDFGGFCMPIRKRVNLFCLPK
jgi:hypothetical protein